MSLVKGGGRISARVKELGVFLFFGGLAALANVLTGWQLYGEGLFPRLPYWCATAIAAACGLLVNFGLNYSFNFRFRDRSAFQQFTTFCVVSLVGVAITSALSDIILSLFTSWTGAGFELGGMKVRSDLAAHVCAVGLTVLYSFPAHKCMSFNAGIRVQARHLCAQLSGRP
ncbi:MAG TPA: GtrA family protein [Rhizomicrobium sp.]|nr:GtrA family protein [Rhizomicrobium sp.]